MNILPKKSWHVRNKNNIERVRRDEEKAAEEEKERQRRVALAESESRTQSLRENARKRRHGTDEADEQITSPSKHMNFFEHLEEGKKLGGKNADYEKEKKEEKEKQEKAIGLLTHLGQGSVEFEGKSPWYLEKSLRDKTDKTAVPTTEKKKSEEIDTKLKRSIDPMSSIVKYVEQTEKVHKLKDSSSDRGSHKRHKSKEILSSKAFGPQKNETVEELRAKRLKREQMERLRQNQILAKARGEKDPAEARSNIVDERLLPYNSQFNPNLTVRHSKRT